MELLKIKLLKLLLNNIYKYNNNDCREKWMETVIDDITYLLKQYDKMSMTKSHSAIVVNVKYQINKTYTFTN